MRRQTFLVAVSGACFALAAFLPASSATAAPEGTLKSMSLELATGIFAGVTVVSSNGTSWTGIKQTDVSLGGSIKVEMKIGRVKAIGIYLGECSGHDCFEQIGTPLLGSAHFGSVANQYGNTVYPKLIDGQMSFSFPAGTLGVSTTGIPVPAFGNAIIARCNAGLKEGQSIHQGFGFTQTVPMTLGADTRTVQAGFSGPGTPGGTDISLGNEPLTDVDFSKTVDVQIPVVCAGVPPGTGAPMQVGANLPPYDVIGATLHGDPAEYAGACPVGIKLFMSATSNIKGPFEARVEAKSGWKSKTFSSQTSDSDADGSWSKHFQDTLTVPIVMPVNQPSSGGAINAANGIGQFGTPPSKPDDTFPSPGGVPSGPSQVQTGYKPGNLHEDSLRLVVTGGDRTVTTDWWKYKVTCDPKKNPAVSGGPKAVGQPVFIEQAALTLFPVAPANGSKCGLTVSGIIQTNVKNIDVMFRLKNHQGNTTNSQTIKTSHAGNIGKFVEYLDFSTSGQGIWVSQGGGWALPGAGTGSQAGPKQGTLQIVVENPAQFESNVASYEFTCYDPAPAGLKPAPTVKVNPNVVTPGALVGRKPVAPAGKKIMIPASVSCAGGRVRHGKCLCKRGFAALATGVRAYRCVRTAVSPTIKRVAPRIACAGGVVRGRRCRCPAGTSLRNGACVSTRVLRHDRVAPLRGERHNGTVLRVR